MIKNIQALNMAEVKKIINKQEGKEELVKFIKKFQKINEEKAEKMKKELEELGLLKLKISDIVKMIDVVPEDASDINKIFIDVGLNEDEINKILGVVKGNL